MADVKVIYECGECGERFTYKTWTSKFDPEAEAEKCCICTRCGELIGGAGPNQKCDDCNGFKNADNDSKEE